MTYTIQCQVGLCQDYSYIKSRTQTYYESTFSGLSILKLIILSYYYIFSSVTKTNKTVAIVILVGPFNFHFLLLIAMCLKFDYQKLRSKHAIVLIPGTLLMLPYYSVNDKSKT